MKGKKWLILLASLAIVLTAGNAGITASSFLDTDSATGNSFLAWASTLWQQTTQADFNGGVLNNVDISLSPGNVKLAVRSGWYDTSWSRRAPATINNPGSTLTNYQVKVTVTYDADMQSNFNDIRFTAGDGVSLLSCWRQSYTAGVSAVFWVKVTSIPGGSSTIYMYFGNAGATSASNGTATFDFFDDFSSGLGQWTIDPENTDKVYVYTGALRHDPDSSQTKNSYFDTRLITSSYKILNGIIEYEVYLAGSPRIIHQMGWRVPSLNFTNGYCWRVQTSGSDGGHLRFTGRASWTPFGTAFAPVAANNWHSVKEVVNGSTYTGYVDGGSAYSGTDSTKLTADYLVSHVHGVSLDASSYVLVDNIRVRQYVSSEPTTGVGSKEGMYISPGTIASSVLDTGVAGDRWDALFWDQTLQSGTSITFEVRARDTLFAKDTPPGTLPWSPVGGTSPVTGGLPSGEFQQWRATLTTSDASKTPTLNEVRIYHY